MTLVTASIPYLVVSLVIIVGLDKVSILKWTWEPPPSYIRIPVGLLWPIWVLLLLVYAALGRVKNNSRPK